MLKIVRFIINKQYLTQLKRVPCIFRLLTQHSTIILYSRIPSNIYIYVRVCRVQICRVAQGRAKVFAYFFPLHKTSPQIIQFYYEIENKKRFSIYSVLFHQWIIKNLQTALKTHIAALISRWKIYYYSIEKKLFWGEHAVITLKQQFLCIVLCFLCI